jgi:NAD(P)-dependent dehydrogenase (short-subunit alcohol dehydrogenase family)
MGLLDGKIALVTVAGSGISAGIAQAGARVVVIDACFQAY